MKCLQSKIRRRKRFLINFLCERDVRLCERDPKLGEILDQISKYINKYMHGNFFSNFFFESHHIYQI